MTVRNILINSEDIFVQFSRRGQTKIKGMLKKNIFRKILEFAYLKPLPIFLGSLFLLFVFGILSSFLCCKFNRRVGQCVNALNGNAQVITEVNKNKNVTILIERRNGTRTD